jgi:L-aminoadipate-semialdehyde dehydrogenase
MTFVSTGSVSHCSQSQHDGPVYENEDMLHNQSRLDSGYVQSKWVAEQLVMRARSRGLPVNIVRPGSITGDSISGVCNETDTIWRIVQACLILNKAPFLNSAIEICSGDFVANVVIEAVSTPEAIETGAYYLKNPKK